MTFSALIRLIATCGAIVILSIVTAKGLQVDPWQAGIFFTAGAVCLWIAATWYRARTFLPACETGKCRSKDYVGLGSSDQLGISENGLLVRCRCGNRYLHTATRFYAVDDRNGIKRYKVKTGICGRWVEDQ